MKSQVKTLIKLQAINSDVVSVDSTPIKNLNLESPSVRNIKSIENLNTLGHVYVSWQLHLPQSSQISAKCFVP